MPANERHYRLLLVTIWLAGAAAAIAVTWASIAQFRFWDPDDVMRLLEVRDWLAGQSWFDVSQHRMNPPTGLSMHWSRLLDIPLAALIQLLEPLVGQRAAETVAAVVVPMLTLGGTMGLVAAIARNRAGPAAGLLAASFCLLSIGTWYAMLPMRIDHHGWQIVCGLGMVWALVARADRKGAILAGACAALWTHISLEGLAFTACAAGWLGLVWIARPEQEARPRLPPFLAALAASSALLYLGVHGTASIGHTYCDQISPLHILLFAFATLLTYAAAALPSGARIPRIFILTAMAGGCLLFYRLGAPQCAAGPFGAMGPLGHGLWYANVNEGRPLWTAPADTRLLWGVFPWVGLAGALVMAFRRADRAMKDWTYCALLAAATGIGLLVTRTGAFANLLAIPGAAGLALLIVDRTENWPVALRVIARAATILLFSPFGAQSTALWASAAAPGPAAAAMDRQCRQIDSFAGLNRITPTTVLAPLEQGPLILAGSHHYAVTGPYHRDPDAMEDLLHFFTADERTAHGIAARRKAGLVIFCPEGEMAAMARFAPHGLAAALLRGHAPNWLQSASLSGVTGLRLYRIVN